MKKIRPGTIYTRKIPALFQKKQHEKLPKAPSTYAISGAFDATA